MKSRTVFKMFLIAFLPTGSYLATPVANAQSGGRALEEITVTAQKREESLSDVPISVAAFAGEAMRANNVTTLQALSSSVPNFYVAESFVGDAMYVRGVGSGQNNLGFEQAVGQVVDGFFYGRSRFSRVAFLDLERVEVLKGPQGALLGKNTTAGAVNITTAKPTSEFEASISPSWEFEAGEGARIEGVVSGPLSENLRARLAVIYVDQDGHIDNSSTGSDQVEIEDLAGRLSLAWDVTDNVDVLLQYQFGELEHHGGNNQYSFCDKTSDQNGPGPGLGGFIPGTNLTASLTTVFPDDCTTNYTRSGQAPKFGVNVEGKETSFDTLSLTLDWRLGDLTLTSLTGYAQYDYLDLQDGDRTAAESVLPEFGEDYEQLTQEFRVTSDIGESYDFIAGVYYQTREQDTAYLVHFAPIGANSRNTFTNEEGDALAAFGQVTWHLNDAWDLTLGGRYTYEEKEATSVQYPTDNYDRSPDNGCPIVSPTQVCSRHNLSDKFDEDDFSPVLNVQWRPTDDAMYYFSARQGFKAGGFDHDLAADQSDPDIQNRFRFDDEEVTAFELGAKLTLLENTMQLNAAAFHMEFDDLQLAGFLDSAGAVGAVTNAASATSEGLEADVRWAATDRLTLSAAVAWLDSSYDDYPDAPCYTLQTAGCVNGRQDLSGEKLQFATDWKGNMAAEYVWTLTPNLNLTGYATVYSSDSFPLQADLDPKLFQDDFTKWDARLTLSQADGDWEVSLVGRNLSDKLTSHYGDDVPGQAGSVWRSVDAPRSLALQGVLRF